MTKESFLSELLVLLKDISEEERQAALDYYRGYFDDAGPEQEENIIRQLGSPARVAAMIKRDIQDANKAANEGEYTENGYQSGDKQPSQQMVAQGASASSSQYSYSNTQQDKSANQYQNNQDHYTSTTGSTNNGAKIVLIITLCILGFPVIMGFFGICMGLLGGLIGIVFGLSAATLGLFVGGVCCVVYGAFQCYNGFGVLIIGVGILLIGISLLLLILSIWIWGTAIPGFVRAVVRWIRSLFGRKETQA